MTRVSGADVVVRQVAETVRSYQMLRPGENVLVAVSGGPDSVALLHVLRALAPELQIALAVAHLNHCLRGADSDQDEEYVRQLCASWGLTCHVRRQDVAARAEQQGLSREEAGRVARYEFFAHLVQQPGFHRVALGHTATDRAETLVINLLRGTGLYGLAGIAPVRGPYVRPLINTTRDATVAYCNYFHLEPRCDETNLVATEALRNKVRLELLPQLAREYARDPVEMLLRVSQAAEAELAWTEPLVQAEFARLGRTSPGRVVLDRGQLAEMPVGLRQRLLRCALVALCGEATDVAAVHYGTLCRLVAAGPTGAELHLPGRVLVRIGYTEVEFMLGGTPEGGPGGREWSYELPVPGTVLAAEAGVRVAAEVLAERPTELGDARGSHTVMDAEAVRPPLQVRSWQAGDTMRPLGMSGHKKVQDLFVDAKVPRYRRRMVPLIVDRGGRIIWAVGVRVGEECRVTRNTAKFLRLSITSGDSA